MLFLWVYFFIYEINYVRLIIQFLPIFIEIVHGVPVLCQDMVEHSRLHIFVRVHLRTGPLEDAAAI